VPALTIELRDRIADRWRLLLDLANMPQRRFEVDRTIG
jgi:hypothetical protein